MYSAIISIHMIAFPEDLYKIHNIINSFIPQLTSQVITKYSFYLLPWLATKLWSRYIFYVHIFAFIYWNFR